MIFQTVGRNSAGLEGIAVESNVLEILERQGAKTLDQATPNLRCPDSCMQADRTHQ